MGEGGVGWERVEWRGMYFLVDITGKQFEFLVHNWKAKSVCLGRTDLNFLYMAGNHILFVMEEQI